MCVIKGMKTTYLKVTNPGIKLSYLTENYVRQDVISCVYLPKPQASINLTVALHIYDFPALNAVFCLFFFYRSRYKSMGVICQ